MAAVVGATEGLVAAFTFGIVVNAASAAVFLYVKGHGSSVFRDSQRLVLVLFLLSAALWAQVDFVTVLIDIRRTSTPCQVGVVFATIFDQLARFSIEQFLLWAINSNNTGGKASVAQTLPQILILLRFIAGAIFVGFTRPQTDTFCVATTSALPIGILVVAMDAIIIVWLAIRSVSAGGPGNGTPRSQAMNLNRKRMLSLVLAGLSLWTATSVMLLLGLETVALAARTALPAGGLTVLIIIVTCGVDTLLSTKSSSSRTPEAPSPRRLNISRDISTADSDYPPSRYEDLKEAAIRSSTTFVNPREAPKAKDETGFGLPYGLGTVAEGALVAPQPASLAGGGAMSKGAYIDFSKGRSAAAFTRAKLNISKPILRTDDAQNPLNKIAVIDLEEAAMAEKQRRVQGQATANVAPVRPARPPSENPEDGVRRTFSSTKRKEVQSVASARQSLYPSTLQPENTALTTSAQLSPGGDEARRRSPRPVEGQEQMSMQLNTRSPISQPTLTQWLEVEPPRKQSTSPVPSSQLASAMHGWPAQDGAKPFAISSGEIEVEKMEKSEWLAPLEKELLVERPIPLERQTSSESQNSRLSTRPVPRADIRPSRVAPPSPKTPPQETVMTALQRRPTIGLPTNPRARGLKLAQDAAGQQTVMFVNNIVYNDPVGVQAVIKDASDQRAAKPAPEPTSKQTIKVTAEQTAEEDQAHPDPPGTATSVVNRPRPIPRKVTDPPGEASPLVNHRRSKSGGSLIGRKSILTSAAGSPTQLPPLPVLPPRSAGAPARPQPNDTKSMTVDEKMVLFFPNPPSGNAMKRRSSVPQLPPIPLSYLDMASSSSPTSERPRSNHTTRTSVRTESVLEVDEIIRQPQPQREVYRISSGVYPNAVNTTSGWFTSVASTSEAPSRQPSMNGPSKRDSLPIPPVPPVPARASAWTETTDDGMTAWSSVLSPEIVSVSVAQKVGLPSSVRMIGRPAESKVAKPVAPEPANRDSGTLPIMLQQSSFTNASSSRASSSPSESAASERQLSVKSSPVSQSGWHRRVGDECPTFSDRKEKTRSRKGPPPTPLLLNSISSKKTIIMQAEPSPLESPEQAIQQIQAQLKKLDQPDRNSLESPSRRLELLENLELEMGQQEDHWQELKHDIGRDSLSSIQADSQRNSRAEPAVVAEKTVAPEPPNRNSIGAERRASRLMRMRSGAGNSVRAAEPGTRDSVSPQLSKWQKRLTEAQMEYMDAQLLRQSSVNFLQLSRPSVQLGSPTPPDSDHSDDEAPSLMSQIMASKPQVQASSQPEAKPEPKPVASSLWTQPPKKDMLSTSLMWAHVPKAAPEPETPLPGLSVRPALRTMAAPLRIHSTQLWRKPHGGVARSTTGLWRPVWASAAPPADMSRLSMQGTSQSQKAPRPVTQRPPRRNKRVTLLPDILESPEPLPNDRGTLGIFQFPWGEKSDTAMVQPRASMLNAMPGTMSSGRISRQQESSEYSSSFFDDYDDEEDEDEDAINEANSDDGSDDGFDETTLWEIASLLKTDAVPSKYSLLPPPSSSVVDDYLNELPSDDEGRSSASSSRGQSIVIGLAEEPSALHVEKPAPKPAVRMGLPANPKASLKTRPTAASAESAEIPTPAPKLSQISLSSGSKQGSAGLWQPAAAKSKVWTTGTIVPNKATLAENRTTSEEPAAKHMSRTPPPSEKKPLEKLSSTSLWTPRSKSSDALANSWIHGNRRHSESDVQSKPTRPTATPADWKAALYEAIAASYPPRSRFTATAAEWTAALEEALAASYPAKMTPVVAPFDASVRHPVFAAKSLVTRSEWFHPAATGYTYDVSNIHPVFFGSLAITCPEEAVHPAMSAYAAKKIRRQRVKQDRERRHSRAQSGVSELDSISRSGSQRKSEVVQQQSPQEEDIIIMAPPPPPMPALPPMSRQDSIQAQIEALEQERLFVQQAAQQLYRRRTSMTYTPPPPPPVPETEPEPMLAGIDTVQALQRRLSQRIRQSLVISKPARSTFSSSSSSYTSRRHPLPPLPAQPIIFNTGLWSAPQAARSTLTNTTTPHLWTPSTDSYRGTLASTTEDAEAARRRAKGRKTMQKMKRRAEILAQIDAVNAGVNPFVDFSGQGLWLTERAARAAKEFYGSDAGRRDWLHNMHRRSGSRGVALRR